MRSNGTIGSILCRDDQSRYGDLIEHFHCTGFAVVLLCSRISAIGRGKQVVEVSHSFDARQKRKIKSIGKQLVFLANLSLQRQEEPHFVKAVQSSFNGIDALAQINRWRNRAHTAQLLRSVLPQFSGKF